MSEFQEQRTPSAWSEFGDGHDYSRTGKHDPNHCRLCMREALARQQEETKRQAALLDEWEQVIGNFNESVPKLHEDLARVTAESEQLRTRAVTAERLRMEDAHAHIQEQIQFADDRRSLATLRELAQEYPPQHKADCWLKYETRNLVPNPPYLPRFRRDDDGEPRCTCGLTDRLTQLGEPEPDEASAPQG